MLNPDGYGAPPDVTSGGSGSVGAGVLGGLFQAGTAIYLQSRQNKANKELAQFQADANQRYLQQQLDYNSPKEQMRRWQEAGLNPNLIYGQGNPGNQSSPLQYPTIPTTDYMRLMNILPVFNQTRLTDSQVQATNAKTRQTTVLTEVNQLQARVLEKNPLLNTEGFNATIDMLKSTAEIKASESGIRKQDLFVSQAASGLQVQKLEKEVELLEQRFKLGSLDQNIKAQVLQGKEFQNAILEVQKRFMTDADITPQHVYQFVTMLLMKLL